MGLLLIVLGTVSLAATVVSLMLGVWRMLHD